LTHKKHSEEISFFQTFGMFFWRTGGYSCSIKVVNRGLSINVIKFLNGKMSTVKFVNFLVIKNLALDPDSMNTVPIEQNRWFHPPKFFKISNFLVQIGASCQKQFLFRCILDLQNDYVTMRIHETW
jgi:hypothetical protein